MAYTINLTDGAIFATIPDGTIDTSSSMVLVGKNYAGYGEFLDENFIHLLESGANTVPPSAPLTGQLWWDKTTNTMKVYNGTVFKVISGATASSSAPTSNVAGDLWWDSVNLQLKVWNGSSFTLVGPATSGNVGTSGAVVTTLTDNTATQHVIIQLFVENTLVGVVSKDSTFTPQTAIPGFATIGPGIQLSTNVPSALFRGTAINAQTLDSLSATAFMRTASNTSTQGTLAVLNDAGLTVGLDQDARISVATATSEVTLQNQTADANLSFKVNDGGVTTTAISINGGTAQVSMPAAAGLSVTGPLSIPSISKTGSNAVGNIGSSTSAFNTVFATTFEGQATSAATVSGTVSAANGGTGRNTLNANSVLIGNGVGQINFVAPGTNGNVLTASGGQWVSQAGSGGGGTVTSVGLSAPTGFSISGSPVTGSGTLILSFASGYSLPTNSSQSNWDTAFTDRLKWDGGSTGLNATTGRTSLGLGTMATEAAASYVSVSGAQTGAGNITGAKEFTGGIVSTNYNFTNLQSIGINGGSTVEIRPYDVSSYTALRIFRNGSGNPEINLGGSGIFGLADSGTVGGVGWSAVNGLNIDSSSGGNCEFTTANVGKVGGGTFYATSDSRLKINIRDYDVGLDAVVALSPKRFDLLDRERKVTYGVDRVKLQDHVGLIAQDVKDGDLGEMVSEAVDGYYNMDVSTLTYALVNAVKELNQEVTALRTELAALKSGA